MDRVTVAITGINAVDNPGPGVGVARSLKEDSGLDARIVGLAYDAMEPGVYMDWVIDAAYMMPYPSGGFEAYFQRLSYIADREGVDVVIPTLDTELPLFIRHADRIQAAGLRTFLPSDRQYRLRGKDRLSEVARSMNIALPKTEVVSSYDELSQAVDQIGLPVMIKGAYYKARRAYTLQEAASAYSAIVAEWGYPIVVQEVVSGEELNVVAVGDGEGGTLGRVAVKKMWITELGKIWTGVTIHNKAMLDATDRFAAWSKWRGPFELECIIDGDTVYLIEINPRFPAWSYFATGVGLNLPSRIVRRLMGFGGDDQQAYPSGKLFVRYTYEMVTDRAPFERMMTRGER